MDRATTLSQEELEAFLQTLTSYTPALPDSLLTHYLSRAGFSTPDKRVHRLIALAAQKFLADVSNDALAHARLRQTSMPSTKKGAAANRDLKLTLMVDDLERALREYGVALCKPPYFADSVSAGVPDAPTQKPPLPTAPGAAAAAAASAGAGPPASAGQAPPAGAAASQSSAQAVPPASATASASAAPPAPVSSAARPPNK